MYTTVENTGYVLTLDNSKYTIAYTGKKDTTRECLVNC